MMIYISSAKIKIFTLGLQSKSLKLDCIDFFNICALLSFGYPTHCCYILHCGYCWWMNLSFQSITTKLHPLSKIKIAIVFHTIKMVKTNDTYAIITQKDANNKNNPTQTYFQQILTLTLKGFKTSYKYNHRS